MAYPEAAWERAMKVQPRSTARQGIESPGRRHGWQVARVITGGSTRPLIWEDRRNPGPCVPPGRAPKGRCRLRRVRAARWSARDCGRVGWLRPHCTRQAVPFGILTRPSSLHTVAPSQLSNFIAGWRHYAAESKGLRCCRGIHGAHGGGRCRASERPGVSLSRRLRSGNIQRGTPNRTWRRGGL